MCWLTAEQLNIYSELFNKRVHDGAVCAEIRGRRAGCEWVRRRRGAGLTAVRCASGAPPTRPVRLLLPRAGTHTGAGAGAVCPGAPRGPNTKAPTPTPLHKCPLSAGHTADMCPATSQPRPFTSRLSLHFGYSGPPPRWPPSSRKSTLVNRKHVRVTGTDGSRQSVFIFICYFLFLISLFKYLFIFKLLIIYCAIIINC